MERRYPAFLVALLLVASSIALAVPAVATPSPAIPGLQAQTDSPPDPDEDRLGWEAGYWHNETLAIDYSDGLNRSELDVVLGRTMARVESVRQLEFEETPPVSFLTRSEFAGAIDRAFADQNVSTKDRLHQNTKFEALFLVGENTSFFDVQRQNQQGFAAAFYATQPFPAANVSTGEIVIVRSGGDEVRLTETTLAHELVHALQDQHFDLSSLPNGNTEDEALAVGGLTEGDATYTQSRYADRCSAGWAETCLSADRSGSSSLANVGLAFYDLVQYGNGMTFVGDVHSDGGWEAVNALYENPPNTTEQLIHPEAYPDERHRNLSIEDRSNETWRPLDLPGGVDYAEFGEAGLFVSFWYPSYRQQGNAIIPYDEPFVDRQVQPYDLDHAYSAGWDGDKLLPFVTNESARTNETGYVWKIAWDSPGDAEEFVQGYRQILEYYGAEQVGANTYRITKNQFGPDFADAIHLTRDDDLITIVNAPTVGELSAVRGSVEVNTTTPSPTPTGPQTGTTTDSTASPTDTSTDTTPGTVTETETSGQPGFGAIGAMLALLLALFVRRR